MATKILISFYCPDFSSTGIVKTSFDKVYDCRKFSEHCKTNWHDPKIEKVAPSDLQIRKATVLGLGSDILKFIQGQSTSNCSNFASNM